MPHSSTVSRAACVATYIAQIYRISFKIFYCWEFLKWPKILLILNKTSSHQRILSLSRAQNLKQTLTINYSPLAIRPFKDCQEFISLCTASAVHFKVSPSCMHLTSPHPILSMFATMAIMMEMFTTIDTKTYSATVDEFPTAGSSYTAVFPTLLCSYTAVFLHHRVSFTAVFLHRFVSYTVTCLAIIRSATR